MWHAYTDNFTKGETWNIGLRRNNLVADEQKIEKINTKLVLLQKMTWK